MCLCLSPLCTAKWEPSHKVETRQHRHNLSSLTSAHVRVTTSCSPTAHVQTRLLHTNKELYGFSSTGKLTQSSVQTPAFSGLTSCDLQLPLLHEFPKVLLNEDSFYCTNSDKQAADKLPEWLYADAGAPHSHQPFTQEDGKQNLRRRNF